jgi:hypothetical protein
VTRTRTLVALGLAACIPLSGCLAIFHGGTRTVNVSCDVPDAKLTLDGTPVDFGQVSVPRKVVTLRATAPGGYDVSFMPLDGGGSSATHPTEIDAQGNAVARPRALVEWEDSDYMSPAVWLIFGLVMDALYLPIIGIVIDLATGSSNDGLPATIHFLAPR